MKKSKVVDSIDANETDFRHFVWCDRSGLNDGSASDKGELAGATISSYTVTPTNITISADNKDAVTIKYKNGLVAAYAADVVVTVKLTSASTTEDQAEVLCQIVTSDGRTLEQTMIIPIEVH
jgi:hypothetical protein